jgi:hypothetical protein
VSAQDYKEELSGPAAAPIRRYIEHTTIDRHKSASESNRSQTFRRVH